MNLCTDQASFADVLQRFHAEKHTGAVTIHFAQGHPRVVEIRREPDERIVLDRRRPKPHP